MNPLVNHTLIISNRNRLKLAPKNTWIFFFFQGLTNLVWLHLNGNSLQLINQSLFSDQTSLKELYLYDNEIELIESNSFANLVQLKILDLNKNNLKGITASTFGGLTSLRGLGLEQNRIAFLLQLEAGFKQLPSLLRVCLQGNPVTKLPERVLQRLCDKEIRCTLQTGSSCLKTIQTNNQSIMYSDVFGSY